MRGFVRKKFLFARLFFLTSSIVVSLSGTSAASGLGGEGHDVPTPFELANPKLELADGEIYQLAGWVVAQEVFTDRGVAMVPYFQVDLRYAPWLATKKRVIDPFYQMDLSDSLVPWLKKGSQRRVVLVRAKGRVEQDRDGSVQYKIVLNIIE